MSYPLKTPLDIHRHATFLVGAGVLHLESQGVTVTEDDRKSMFDRTVKDLTRESREFTNGPRKVSGTPSRPGV